MSRVARLWWRACAVVVCGSLLALAPSPASAEPTTAKATATPATGVKAGDTVTVHYSGLDPSSSMRLIVECDTATEKMKPSHGGSRDYCANPVTTKAPIDGNGAGSFAVRVKTGALGTKGHCDPGGGCIIMVWFISQSTGTSGQTQRAFAPISIAGDSTATSGDSNGNAAAPADSGSGPSVYVYILIAAVVVAGAVLGGRHLTRGRRTR